MDVTSAHVASEFLRYFVTVDVVLVDISQLFQLLLVTALVILTPKVPSSFPMQLHNPFILIFARVLEVADLALPSLL